MSADTIPKISKWDIAGVPVAMIAAALNRLHAFQALGIEPENIPDVILLGFVAVACIRMAWTRVETRKQR